MRGARDHDSGEAVDSPERPKLRIRDSAMTREERKTIKMVALVALKRSKFNGRPFRRYELATALGLTRQQVWNLEQEIEALSDRVAAHAASHGD